MEGSHESAIASGDFPTAENEKTIFSIEDVELEAFESTGLGDTQDAREDHGAADLKIGKTSLDAVFTEIIYGSYKGRPACRAMIEFTIKSTADFRVRSATLACTVGSEATNRLQISSSDVVRPSVLKTVPRDLNDDTPTAVGITATLDLSPNVSIPDGPQISIGSFTKQKTYTEVYGWHLHSSVTSSEGQKATTRDYATWDFTANKMQKDSKLHVFSIEVLIRHAGQPFYADFEIEATLAFSASLRKIGKKRKIQTRRRFFPFQTSIVFSN
jgi:hypothetical protein